MALRGAFGGNNNLLGNAVVGLLSKAGPCAEFLHTPFRACGAVSLQQGTQGISRSNLFNPGAGIGTAVAVKGKLTTPKSTPRLSSMPTSSGSGASRTIARYHLPRTSVSSTSPVCRVQSAPRSCHVVLRRAAAMAKMSSFLAQATDLVFLPGSYQPLSHRDGLRIGDERRCCEFHRTPVHGRRRSDGECSCHHHKVQIRPGSELFATGEGRLRDAPPSRSRRRWRPPRAAWPAQGARTAFCSAFWIFSKPAIPRFQNSEARGSRQVLSRALRHLMSSPIDRSRSDLLPTSCSPGCRKKDLDARGQRSADPHLGPGTAGSPGDGCGGGFTREYVAGGVACPIRGAASHCRNHSGVGMGYP
jgi:hypothetical protein